VAQGKFTVKGSDVDMTSLELAASFQQVKAFLTMREKLRQARRVKCVNRREISHTIGWKQLLAPTIPTA
jgi:hypothetical protein